MKDLSNIIKGLEKLPYNGYVRNRSKCEPNDSYFYIASHLAKCMVISDAVNLYGHLVRT